MTIRLRLALWYGALLAVVLGVTLSVAFGVHARTHETDVDASLRSSWEHAVTEVATLAMPMHGAVLTAPSSAADAPTALWLIAPGETLVRFTPQRPGRYAFTCGMGMYSGELVVRGGKV